MNSARRRRRLPCLLAQSCILAACATTPAPLPVLPPGNIAGVVFLDRDGDGVRGPGEPGLAGVAVSNGRDVVRSDRHGHYQLPVADDTSVFVVQPRGHRVPVDIHGVPRFYYVHKPAGSPSALHFAGVAATGALPARIDFPLLRSPVGDRFAALLFGDTQIRDARDLEFLARDIVAPLVDAPVAFGITLGDLVFDNLDLFEPLMRTLGRIGVPWWSVLGNHDLNFDAQSDRHSDETWERVFGPRNYAFQVGRVHFIVLDSVQYDGWNTARGAPGAYRGHIDAEALRFLEAYLAVVPHEELVVVAAHIPLVLPEGQRIEGADRLLALLSARPHTLSVSAHSHRQFQLFLGAEQGFGGASPHHHVNTGATSGSWWLGALDEDGIPHATMRDGTPNGYWIAHFDGAEYRLEFRAARRPAEHQINVVAPFRIGTREAARTEILANVFAGSPRTEVAMQIDAGDWHPMRRTPRADPLFEAVFRREQATPESDPRSLRPPGISTHIWSGTLPAALRPGPHVVTIRATDPFLGTLRARHILDVSD